MTHTYQPNENLPPEQREESARLAERLNDAQPEVVLQYLHAEPARVRKGMLVLADGTDWDPGSGAGLYRRNEANNAWVFIG